jgi:hypothetical protein
MKIQNEEILLKEFTSGTTLTFFSTRLDAIKDDLINAGIDVIPTVIWMNNIGQPFNLTTFDGQNLWTLNSQNIYVPLETISSNNLTGYCYVQEKDYILDDNKFSQLQDSFSQQITDALVTGETTTTSLSGETDPNPSIVAPHIDYVFRSFKEIDDFYVSVKLNRTFGTLDTLNIYNNIVNSIPTQDAKTGVVFGRLMALQTLKDSEGNNIRIPLRNVPVGIFNSSDDYPTSSSVSDNGDRIFLNLKESTSQGEYFNVESFELDKNKLLRSASQFTTVPPHYKYVTTTNDEGEFVIYDAPIGTQIFIFEVDLLKQGLTRDEIALNFFPFPPDDDAIIDQIPNFAFKQFPIDVVPAWGTIQTGYTELNITINLDLRKWTTYIFPPVAVDAQNLESAVAQNAANSAKVEIRNMAKEGFPKTEIKLAEVPNDLDRVVGQQFNWQLEFAQIKNKVEFYKFGCPIVKLPANLYDPNGYKTDSDGNPTSHKGVWLSAYQLKLYATKDVSRKTGSIYAWNGSAMYTKSHFDLNFSPSVLDDPGLIENEGLGTFPYERPWTLDYPNQYRIPKKPTDERYRYENGRTPTSVPGTYYLDEPAYNDGDLVGYEVQGNDGSLAGGFGSQSLVVGGIGLWLGNRISQVATKNFMYKYEDGVAWNEEYANGYQPSNPGYLRFPGESQVINGEKYQRFEAGYGYFLKPSGWPRIMRTLWGSDTYFGPDISYGNGLGGDSENPGPGTTNPITVNSLKSSDSHRNDVYNLNNINLALVLDGNAGIKKGTLEAYRIINSNPNNLNAPGTFVVPTSVRLACSVSAERLYSFVLKNTGDIPVTFPFQLYGGVSAPSGTVLPGQNITLNPGQSYTVSNPADGGLFPPGFVLAYTSQNLPGNKNFNPSTNRYDVASYELRFNVTSPVNNNNVSYVQFDRAAYTTPDTWYMKTHHSGGNSGQISNGINTLQSGDPGEVIWSIEIQDNDLSYDL